VPGLGEPTTLVASARCCADDGLPVEAFAAQVVGAMAQLSWAAHTVPDRIGTLRATQRALCDARRLAVREDKIRAAQYLAGAGRAVGSALLVAELRGAV
jgi:hypothetical protein